MNNRVFEEASGIAQYLRIGQFALSYLLDSRAYITNTWIADPGGFELLAHRTIIEFEFRALR